MRNIPYKVIEPWGTVFSVGRTNSSDTCLNGKCSKNIVDSEVQHKAASIMKVDGETRQVPKLQVQSDHDQLPSLCSIASIQKLCDCGTLEITENMHRIVWPVEAGGRFLSGHLWKD